MATLFILMSLMTLMGCHGDSMTLPLEDCRSMVPPDHDKLPQTTTTAPYEITFSDKCFKTGLSLRVTLAGTNGSVFTSFLVQAKKPNDDSFSYGTFSSAPGDDPEIDTIDCFNQSASAIGHYNETGYNFTRAAFDWTAPADVNIDVLEFVASVILDKETWIGLRSPIARCNDNRDNSSLSENNEMTSESTVSIHVAAQTTTTTTTETQPATTATTTTEIPPATTATTTTATEAPPATTATTTTTEIPAAATATMTTATEAPQATAETTAIGNFTIATDGTGNGTGYTWSTVAATATSTNESHTVAITSTSMNNQTTSGADRRKESMASLAFSVAFVASLALIHQQQLA